MSARTALATIITLFLTALPGHSIDRGLAEVLPEARWKQVDSSIDRALAWMATQQAADGAFAGGSENQPAITSLAVMAFLARGHQPGKGPYGEHLNLAIDFVLSTKKQWGILSQPMGGSSVSYNHAIAGLMLGEVYGLTDASRSLLIKDTIEAALKATWSIQLSPKSAKDKGGWRYTSVSATPPTSDNSDLSVTGWHLMFLRSAKNAEFDVPRESIDQALAYVRRCFQKDTRSSSFGYQADRRGGSMAMTGTGTLSLILGGNADDPMVKAAAKTIRDSVARSGKFNDIGTHRSYALYYCSQAMAQMGGEYWSTFYPAISAELVAEQAASGSWDEAVANKGSLGQGSSSVYNTALAVLALAPPYQMLPIFQK
jgi:hypothetical protein